MDQSSVSNRLNQTTLEKDFYHPIQLSLFATASYISTACLTSISPLRGMTLAIVAYSISQLIAPIFADFFETFRELTLLPLAGQVLQLATTFIITKVICYIVGAELLFKEIRQIVCVFLISLFIARFAIIKFRQFLNQN